MSNVYVIKGLGGVKIPVLATDPSSPENGVMWYNTTDGVFKIRENGETKVMGSTEVEAIGVSYDNSASGLEAEDVQSAIDEVASIASDADGKADDAQDDIDAHISAVTDAHASSAISYDNATSGLSATTVKTAIDELAASSGSAAAENVSYNNTISGLAAEDVQAAVDELAEEQAVLSAGVADLVTLSGVPANSDDLGSFDGTIIGDNESIKGALQDLEDYILALPEPIQYKGTWDASTNTPELLNADTDVNGFLYRVTVAGTVDFGAGDISFEIGDSVVNNGTVWEKWDHSAEVLSVNGQTGAVSLGLDDLDDVDVASATDGQVLTYDNDSGEWVAASLPTAPVSSVNGETGAVVLDSDDIDEGSANLYFTEERVLATEVEESVSLEAKLGLIDAEIGTKISALSEDATPTLGGDLSHGDHAILTGTNGLKVGQTGSANCVIKYTQATLDQHKMNHVILPLGFDHTVFSGCVIEYAIKESVTNRVRTGTLYIASNGTDTSISDTGTETGDVSTEFSLQPSGLSTFVLCTTGANAKTFRATQRLFRV